MIIYDDDAEHHQHADPVCDVQIIDDNSDRAYDADKKWIDHRLHNDEHLKLKIDNFEQSFEDLHHPVDAEEEHVDDATVDDDTSARLKFYYYKKYDDKYKRKRDDTIYQNKHFKAWIQKAYNDPSRFLADTTVQEEYDLRMFYQDKYADKHKRKKDATIFDSPHFHKWYDKAQKNPDKFFRGGGNGDVLGGITNTPGSSRELASIPENMGSEKLYYSPGIENNSPGIENKSPTRSSPELDLSHQSPPPTPSPPESTPTPSTPSSSTPSPGVGDIRYLAFNMLLQQMNLMDFSDSESTHTNNTGTQGIPTTPHYSTGGGPRERGVCDFTDDDSYQFIRLVTDIKHDFGMPLDKCAFLENAFFFKVIHLDKSMKFYENLFIMDPNDEKKAQEFNPISTFGKQCIVYDTHKFRDWLSVTQHEKDNQPLKNINKTTELFTYANYMDPGPHANNHEIRYGFSDYVQTTLNNIIATFFRNGLINLLKINKKDIVLLDNLIPRLTSFYEDKHFEFTYTNGEKVTLIKSDFSKNSIKQGLLSQKLGKCVELNKDHMFLYTLLFKELGDHVQLHELCQYRKNEWPKKFFPLEYEEKSPIFGSYDTIIIADAIREDYPVTFHFDSLGSKFDPIHGSATLIDIDVTKTNTQLNVNIFDPSHLFYYDAENTIKQFDLVQNKNDFKGFIMSKLMFYRRYNLFTDSVTYASTSIEQSLKNQLFANNGTAYKEIYIVLLDLCKKIFDWPGPANENENLADTMTPEKIIATICEIIFILDTTFEITRQYIAECNTLYTLLIDHEALITYISNYLSHFVNSRISGRNIGKSLHDMLNNFKHRYRTIHLNQKESKIMDDVQAKNAIIRDIKAKFIYNFDESIYTGIFTKYVNFTRLLDMISINTQIIERKQQTNTMHLNMLENAIQALEIIDNNNLDDTYGIRVYQYGEIDIKKSVKNVQAIVTHKDYDVANTLKNMGNEGIMSSVSI
jgi:hypothetical protein